MDQGVTLILILLLAVTVAGAVTAYMVQTVRTGQPVGLILVGEDWHDYSAIVTFKAGGTASLEKIVVYTLNGTTTWTPNSTVGACTVKPSTGRDVPAGHEFQILVSCPAKITGMTVYYVDENGNVETVSVTG